MAGTIDLVQRCYTGLETREDALWLDPRLPDELHQLDFEFSYRSQRIQATITGDLVELAATARTGTGSPVTARVAGRAIDLSPGERVVVELTSPKV
jgi:trehalose/maltose hydrolase-like predicted phosphorylase